MTYSIEEQTLQKIMTYLSTQPYREVAALLSEIQVQIAKAQSAAEKESVAS